MKRLFLGCLIVLFGCASPRTKFTDKNMRVMIDPSIDEANRVLIQTALVENGKFIVIDEKGQPDNVGAIIVANATCTKEEALFNRRKAFLRCKQSLQLVDSTTREVIAVARGESDSSSTYDMPTNPDWDKTVEALVLAYPKEFKPTDTHAKRISEHPAPEIKTPKIPAPDKKSKTEETPSGIDFVNDELK